MDQPSRLVLYWDFDEPDYGRLSCDATHAGFSGSADQWIGREDLLRFAAALESYPLSAEAPPTLVQDLVQVPSTIQISVRPTGATGELTAFVQLMTDPGFEPRQEARLAIPTEYALVSRFAASIRLMLAAGSGEAPLGPDGAT